VLMPRSPAEPMVLQPNLVFGKPSVPTLFQTLRFLASRTNRGVRAARLHRGAHARHLVPHVGRQHKFQPNNSSHRSQATTHFVPHGYGTPVVGHGTRPLPGYAAGVLHRSVARQVRGAIGGVRLSGGFGTDELSRHGNSPSQTNACIARLAPDIATPAWRLGLPSPLALGFRRKPTSRSL
jgi:hypothetical protein